MLKQGDIAPQFTLPDQNDKPVSLSDFKGKKTVIYFYPKDNTPGCSRQACAFKSAYDGFRNSDIAVIGISKDSTESHRKFIEKYELPFTLISDKNLEAINSFGVWKEKTMFGKKSFGVVRSTFIIDENGIIIKVFPKASPDINAQEVLDFLNK